MNDLILHGYWRSSAAYRVRIALHLKDIAYRQVTHDLRANAQSSAGYRALAPHGLVPAVQCGDLVLIESPAILEWIEARWPEPALLPSDRDDAAIVRAMAALIGCDIHPVNNLRILNALRTDFSASQSQIDAWVSNWIGVGFEALEALIARHGGTFAFGNRPTLADCYLAPQVYNAKRFGIGLDRYPNLQRVSEDTETLPPFIAAHPDRQPDADG